MYIHVYMYVYTGHYMCTCTCTYMYTCTCIRDITCAFIHDSCTLLHCTVRLLAELEITVSHVACVDCVPNQF